MQSSQHRAAPYLWFALYLVTYDETAALLFAANGGLVDTLQKLYDARFPDTDTRAGLNVGLTSLRNRANVQRLCFLVLREMAKVPAVRRYYADRGADLLALRDKFRVHMRPHASESESLS